MGEVPGSAIEGIAFGDVNWYEFGVTSTDVGYMWDESSCVDPIWR